eukprot:6187613-Pleurochrysis_carterae.AAC.10
MAGDGGDGPLELVVPASLSDRRLVKRWPGPATSVELEESSTECMMKEAGPPVFERRREPGRRPPRSKWANLG